ncbi:MAG: L,D-transpeptidase, partial [Dehalococcoidia bacterium]|nr:L,D-transpeptidase [Dehalococcoidia bacterium]
APQETVDASGVPAELADVVARYGMDPSRRFIVVDIGTQRMTVWDPTDGPHVFPISTGDETRGYRTPAWYGLVGRYWGTFEAFGVFADHGWYLFEDLGSILIHGAPYQIQNGQKVYQDLEALGAYPASRGCIRLNPEDATWLTDWGPEGVPLAIVPRE